MYTYADLLKDSEKYKHMGAEVFSIGRSVRGREIFCFAVGNSSKPVISGAGIHARENASAYVVLSQLEFALKQSGCGRQYFIPLINPDGAEILRGYYDRGDEVCRMWKANARGVDLNVNFDARWGSGSQNVFSAGSENYVGMRPFSEPETAALAAFTQSCGAALTLSYHTAGREFYWYFYQTLNRERDYALALFIERELNFYYKRIDGDCHSAGGYKDWCVEKLKIPAFTIELGEGTHPLEAGDLQRDIQLNQSLSVKLAEILKDDSETGQNGNR